MRKTKSDPQLDEKMHELYKQYHISENVGKRDEIVAALHPMCMQAALPILTFSKRKYCQEGRVHADDFDNAADDCMMDVLKYPTIRDFGPAYRSSLVRRLKRLSYKVNRHAYHSVSIESLDNTPASLISQPVKHIGDLSSDLCTIRAALEKENTDRLKLFLDIVYNGMEYAEASKKYSIPIGTVRSRLNRIKSHLEAATQESADLTLGELSPTQQRQLGSAIASCVAEIISERTLSQSGHGIAG